MKNVKTDRMICKEKRKLFFQKIEENPFWKFLLSVAALIGVAIAISTSCMDRKKIYEDRKNHIENFSKIDIGCSKEWLIDAFGAPQFVSEDDKTQELVFVTDIAIIRAFFELQSEYCVMFFITQITDEGIPFPDSMNGLCYTDNQSPEVLGRLTYSDIDREFFEILTVYYYMSNRIPRSFYGEEYCYQKGYSDPRLMVFASMDYGVGSPIYMDVDGALTVPQFFSQLEFEYYSGLLESEYNNLFLRISARDSYKPNTYGLSSLDYIYTFDKLSTYEDFDSTNMMRIE